MAIVVGTPVRRPAPETPHVRVLDVLMDLAAAGGKIDAGGADELHLKLYRGPIPAELERRIRAHSRDIGTLLRATESHPWR